MVKFDAIERAFVTEKKVKLMTHVVGGYPDMDKCAAMILGMAEQGADIIEVQLPYSEPPADGPVIVAANHAALRSGVTTEKVLNMLEQVRQKTEVPILIMSYLNPIFKYGVTGFVDRITDIGLDGMIVPDCPPEESELGLGSYAAKKDCAFVPLFVPEIDDARMKLLCDTFLSPFVYAVLRSGVTGRKTALDSEAVSYLDRVKNISDRYVAAGFGIRSREQLVALEGHADCGIVGTALLMEVGQALEDGKDPVEALVDFVGKLRV